MCSGLIGTCNAGHRRAKLSLGFWHGVFNGLCNHCIHSLAQSLNHNIRYERLLYKEGYLATAVPSPRSSMPLCHVENSFLMIFASNLPTSGARSLA